MATMVHSGRTLGSGRLMSVDRPDSGMTDDLEDSLRILAPTQKKLSSVESQRVMSVATENHKRLERVLALPYLAEEVDRFSVQLGEEIVQSLMEYRSLCDQYTSLYHTLLDEGVDPVQVLQSSDAIYAQQYSQLDPIDLPNEKLLIRTQARLKNVTKNLIRLLNQSPIVEGVLNEFRSTRSSKTNNLLTHLAHFNDVINEKLLTTSIDRKRQLDHIEQTSLRQTETEVIIQQLELDLADAEAKRDKEVSQKDNLKKRITGEIRTVDRVAREAQRKMEDEGKRKESEDNSHHDSSKKQLLEELEGIRKNLMETVASDREIEQNLRKKAFKRETEAENWIQKFDHDMGEQQDELENLQEEYTEEKKQLKELDERLEVLTVEYDAVVKEQTEARIKREEAEMKMVSMTRAAVMIQRFWKAYLVRRGPRKKDKKKGKKGGKKGKKKGKKK